MGWKLPTMRQFVLMGLAFATIGGGLSVYLDGPAEIVGLFGLVMTLLVAAVLQKEHELVKAIDVHSRAKAEYDSVIGTLPVGMFAVLHGRAVYTNEAWNHAHSEVSPDVFDTIHPADRNLLIEHLEHAETDLTSFTLPIRAQGRTGTVHYEAYGSPVITPDGNLLHVLVFCVDVSTFVRTKSEVAKKNRALDEKNTQLNAALHQVERSLEILVETMVRAVEIKDPYTAGHSSRVRQYSTWIGEHVGLGDYEMRILSYGAHIHDVGKIGISDAILQKPAMLTPAEFEAIKLHTVLGARIVGDIDMFRDCVPIVRWHHERLDGSGYPDGLRGEEIPFLARVVAVADVFDAMTSNRSYRDRMPVEDALAIMEHEVANGRLDAIAFEALQAEVSKRGMLPQTEAETERRAA